MFQPWQPRFRWLVGTVLAAAVSTLAIAAVQARVSSARSSASASAAVSAAREPSFQRQSHDEPFKPVVNDVPAVSVQSLPRIDVGTVSLAAVASGHRLFVDGRLAENGSMVVQCGAHVVQVGSKGTKRYVDVPCGKEVVLAK